MFSIERVVNKYCPSLFGENVKYLNPLLAFLPALFHESEIEQRYRYLKGIDFIEQVPDCFDFICHVSERDIVKIPAHGKIVIVASHPISLLKTLEEYSSFITTTTGGNSTTGMPCD